MRLDSNDYIQIPVRSAVSSRLALASDRDHAFIINAGRYVYGKFYALAYSACALTFRTRLFYDLAAASALIARGNALKLSKRRLLSL